MHSLDLSIFYTIYGFSGNSRWVDYVIVFFGEQYTYILLFVFAYFLYREYQAARMSAVYGYCVAAAGAIFARVGVTEVIRFFYHRPRPFIALQLPHLLTDYAYSFPSAHTIFLFALSTGVYFVNRKYSYFLFISAAVVGLARVAAGVHYPSDIVGGVVLGIGTGFVVRRVWDFSQQTTLHRK